MSYNEITIGDKTVQGHRYVGGGVTALYDGNVTTTTTTLPALQADGILYIQGYKDNGATGGTITVSLNNADIIYQVGFITIGAVVATVPVKKGDVIRAVSDYSIGAHVLIKLFKYRS